MLLCLFSVKQEAWETGKSLLLHNKQFDQLTSWLVLFLRSGKEEKAKWWRERRRNTRETPEGPKPCQRGRGWAGLWPHCSVLHKGLCSWGPSGHVAAATTEHQLMMRKDYPGLTAPWGVNPVIPPATSWDKPLEQFASSFMAVNFLSSYSSCLSCWRL